MARPHLTRTWTEPSAAMPAAAVAPLGVRTFHSGPLPSKASSTAASAHPAPRSVVDVGGPATFTSTTSNDGAYALIAAAMPGVRVTWIAPVPSPPTPAPIGGRLGP